MGALFTFLQAVTEEARVLSVVGASVSVLSKPSNMADCWKLLEKTHTKRCVLCFLFLFYVLADVITRILQK